MYVQLTSGLEYVENTRRANENDERKAQTLRSRYLMELDDAIQEVANLNGVILRPALVYGPGEFSTFGTQ